MCAMFLLFSRVQKKEGGGSKERKKKSLYKSGWDMSHMAQLPRNLLRERDLRLRHVAIGAWRNMAHMARNLSQRGRAVPPVAGVVFPLATYCTPSPDFRERWQRGGEGFSRAKGADTMLPVCPIPPLGTPTPTDWPPTLPHRLTGHPFGAHYPHPPTGWPPTGQKGTGHLRPTPGKGPGPRPTSVPTGH